MANDAAWNMEANQLFQEFAAELPEGEVLQVHSAGMAIWLGNSDGDASNLDLEEYNAAASYAEGYKIGDNSKLPVRAPNGPGQELRSNLVLEATADNNWSSHSARVRDVAEALAISTGDVEDSTRYVAAVLLEPCVNNLCMSLPR